MLLGDWFEAAKFPVRRSIDFIAMHRSSAPYIAFLPVTSPRR